jgi:homospermidine synthase
LIGAITWMIQNPDQGVCIPDDIPHEHVLKYAKPYLGNFISQNYDWTPLKHKKILFKKADKPAGNDPWQFESFLFSM